MTVRLFLAENSLANYVETLFGFMAAPSVGRRSRQRQGVVQYEGIENGGLDLFKAAVM